MDLLTLRKWCGFEKPNHYYFDPLIVFRRQNHTTFIFIKTTSHDLLMRMAYWHDVTGRIFDRWNLCQKVMKGLLESLTIPFFSVNTVGIDHKRPASLTCLGHLGLKRTVSSLGDEYQISSGVVFLISSRNAVGEERCVTRQKRLRGRLTQGTLSIYLKPRWPPVTSSARCRRSYTILWKHRGLWTVYTVTEVGFLSQLMREQKSNSLVN